MDGWRYKLNYTHKGIFVFSALSVLLITSLLTCVHALPGGSGRTEVKLETVIAEAAIFSRGKVNVKRTGTVEAHPGFYTYIVEGLPGMTDRSSVRVEGRGSAKAEIMGIEVLERNIDIPTPEEYDALKEKLESLKMKEDSISIAKGALRKRLKFVSLITDISGENAGDEIREQTFSVSDWTGLLNFIEEENREAGQKISETGKELAEIREEIEEVEKELKQLSFTERGNEVRIDCDVESAGRLTFEISYLVDGGAVWHPRYRVIYNPEEERVDLRYAGTIIQKSGEDWEDVSVTLSTARPHVGASPPELKPLYLKRIEGRGDVMHSISSETVEMADVDDLHVRGGRHKSAPVGFSQAGAARTSFSANFSIPGPVSLKSGSSRRILIRRESFPAELSLFSVPRLSENVFVRGKINNSMDIPILEGTAEVYIQTEPEQLSSPVSTFVGEGGISSVPTGGDLVISLGIDQDIEVTQELEKKEYLSGEGDRRKEIRYHYRITAENFKKQPVELTIKDRIPVSTMDDIDIDDVDIEPEPQSRARNGLLTWKLSLVPGERVEIGLEYTVKFPGEWSEFTIMFLE
ncbi:MAG: mucoidy inhibitor MuiA family protein [Candidatus Latescibacteria bacterium]|nr:mucoidy inhibitor MuiA family protein [bacterium]MBD3424018.1 mucoidy inhibitor MuiA family protein [Candidatus Latescibacterota bacterium]